MAEDSTVKVNVPAESIKLTKTWRIAILLEGQLVRGVALVRKTERSGLFDLLIEVRYFRELTSGLPIEDISRAIGGPSDKHLSLALSFDGILPPATAKAFITALERLRPESKDHLNYLRENRPQPRIDITPKQATVMEQRDAVALGLELSGIDSRMALTNAPPVGEIPFLSGLGSATAQESSILRHDVTRFADWKSVETDHFDVWRYQDPQNPKSLVTILYADKGPLETLTGTDLIYFREETNAWVLVQYKRMTPQGRIGLGYRPDKQLDDEIDRMKKLGLTHGPPASVAEMRLSVEPFYIKLVEPDIRRPEGNRLAVGMYFPLELFQLLRNDAGTRGPKGGVVITWKNAQRYLTNGGFTNLVGESWIGTRGSSSEQMSALIREIIDNDRGLILVNDLSDRSNSDMRRH